MQIDNTYFNKAACSRLDFKEFKQAFEGKLTKTPVEVAYKLVTGNNPPSKSGTIRKSKKQGGEDSED